ncbi:hypothetical protein BDEG_20468 [Batrachochytrium dendrobatidis JEL423]|uniref:Uncharacterized protein n=1 Tax=Batrachochytrium dendrobatidis (strain JEL423) TaxID=403673 RepID=A0A177W912_BATDL|nr:hypothetical protein BDEG_20468 [Batrachochytrium dendrobatidis JEL423]
MSSRTADLAHATPTKPSMLLKDLRLSSVDLLNPLSSDLMQFTHPSPEYTPQDFCKENDVTQSGMPSTMMSHFANADDISLSCYDNTIQHAIAQDDLLSMMQAIKDSSIASTNNLDDIIMPSIDKQSSSGSLLQFFSQSGLVKLYIFHYCIYFMLFRVVSGESWPCLCIVPKRYAQAQLARVLFHLRPYTRKTLQRLSDTRVFLA